MRRLLLAFVALLLAVPVAAQATADLPTRGPRPAEAADDTTAADAVDAGLVGRWELAEVEDEGRIGTFGAVTTRMDCTFDADGEGAVTITVEQDRETTESDRTFAFTTVDGQIRPEGAAPVAYELLDSGELRLTTTTGMVVRLRRSQP